MIPLYEFSEIGGFDLGDSKSEEGLSVGVEN